MVFVYTRHDHTFGNDFPETLLPALLVFIKDTPKIHRHRRAARARMKERQAGRGARLAQLVDRAALDLGDLSSSPTLGVAFT